MISHTITWFIPIPPLLVGVALCSWGWIRHQAEKRSLGWPTAEGTILAIGTEGTVHNSNTSAQRFVATVKYRYTWDGKAYESDRIGTSNRTHLTPWLAKRSAKAYRRGMKVTVSVNPSSPQESLLEPGPGTMPILLMVTGAVVALSGFIISQIAQRFVG